MPKLVKRQGTRNVNKIPKATIKTGANFNKIIRALAKHFGEEMLIRDDPNLKSYIFSAEGLQEFSKLLIEDCLEIVEKEGYDIGAAAAAATKIKRRFDLLADNRMLYGARHVESLESFMQGFDDGVYEEFED